MRSQRFLGGLFVLIVVFSLTVSSTGDVTGQAAKSSGGPVESLPDDFVATGTAGPEPSGFAGLNLLQYDDGTICAFCGLGCGAGIGQMLMRFGGAAPTSTLVPFQVRGLYWQPYPGYAGVATNINVNLWHPLTAGGMPTNTLTPFGQYAATTNTAAGFHYAGFAGPTVSTANGSILAGVGISAPGAWFIGNEQTAPAGRQAGGCGNTQVVFSVGGAFDMHIRLQVDGNVPVELESFSID